MSEQIEARRLSGADLGKHVAFDDVGGEGELTFIEHGPNATHITVQVQRGRYTIGDCIGLAPSDLVTVTGRGQS